MKNQVSQAVADAVGKEATDVAAICCDEKGNRLLFIGLPGASYKSFVYNPEPKGEDDSNGYALAKDPAARSLQLAVRQWAIKNERELLRVLEFSSAVEHRRVASNAVMHANLRTRYWHWCEPPWPSVPWLRWPGGVSPVTRILRGSCLGESQV